MVIFVARQPIFNKINKIFGYELLFRDNKNDNYCQNNNGDQATLNVINNTLMNIGIDKITGGTKAFINFTKNILKSDIFSIIPSDRIIIEILETVEPDEEVIEICKMLKKKRICYCS
ncbi:MAG: hypothetical protein WCR27_04410 [Eubacteriales bacterium]